MPTWLVSFSLHISQSGSVRRRALARTMPARCSIRIALQYLAGQQMCEHSNVCSLYLTEIQRVAPLICSCSSHVSRRLSFHKARSPPSPHKWLRHTLCPPLCFSYGQIAMRNVPPLPSPFLKRCMRGLSSIHLARARTPHAASRSNRSHPSFFSFTCACHPAA